MKVGIGIDDLPGAVVAYDSSGRVIMANPAAHALLGLGASELVGTHADDSGWLITDPAGRPQAEETHPALEVLSTAQPQRGIIARVNRRDGSEVWIQVDAVPFATGAAHIGLVVATLSDITRILNDERLPSARYGAGAITEVTDRLATANLDPDAILRSVTSTLSRLRAGTWVAALMNKDPRTVRVVAANEADPEAASYIENMHLRPDAPSLSLSNQVIETGEPLLVPSVPYDEFISMLNPDVRDFLDRNTPPTKPPERLGGTVVPMRARGAVVGTLAWFEWRAPHLITAMDTPWIQEIADRTGLAADNAQLYVDALSRHERLTALRSAGLAISGSPDLRLTLQVILDQTVAGLGIDAADILLVDDEDGMLGLAATTGFQTTSVPDYRIPLDEELPSRAGLGRRIETITALGAFGQFRRRALFAREGFKSYGAVPLVARGKLAGVLEVFHRSPLQPDQEWLEFLDAIGSDAAIAIDRAGLFGQLEQAGRETERHHKAPAPDLSRLEKEILGYVVEGLSNRVIADKVHLSTHTIKFHVGQILDRFGVSNRTELARKATQEGWL